MANSEGGLSLPPAVIDVATPPGEAGGALQQQQQIFSRQGGDTTTVTSRASSHSGSLPRTIGGAHGGNDFSASAQQQPLSTPWTLGSTDGSYAMHVLRVQQQQHLETAGNGDWEGPGSSPVGARLGPTGDVASPETASAMDDFSPGNGDSFIHTAGNHAFLPEISSNQTPNTAATTTSSLNEMMSALTHQQSLFQDRLFRQPSASVEAVLAAACEVMGFDIAEMWLRTGPKTHQLTNSHLRPTALDETARKDLVDVYYGEKSSERTHRLSPALCKRAKEANDVVWVTALTPHGAEALRCSISNVRTAAAIPVCHEASNTNITVIFFSIRRIIVRPAAVEFLVHMSLASGTASVNALAEDGLYERDAAKLAARRGDSPHTLSQSEHLHTTGGSIAIRHYRVERTSVTGARLDLQWRQLENVEYLTDGGNSWIHTAVFNGTPVVVKTLKPECQDVVLAINEIEGELVVHSRLNHPHIVGLVGAGTTSRGVRFVVLERLDGGTLTQMLGYDNRIRDRRRRFWKKKQFSFLDVLRTARSIAEAMQYLHEEAIPGSVVLHRDLKPDNIGFTLDGRVKILDFGLARIIENASVDSDEAYAMSGETGSLRYMAPEVADGLPYNFTADVYSFGIILWELNTFKKPFEGLNRELFYERIVHGGERPPTSRRWPQQLIQLMTECWDADMQNRPKFRDIVARLDGLLDNEKGGTPLKKQFLPKLGGMIDRHSTWF